MLLHLLQSSIIMKIFLNVILVSIPEEFYLVLVILIFAGEYEDWGDKENNKLFQRYDWFRLSVPTIVSALLSDILRYNGIVSTWSMLLPPILLFMLVILTNDPFEEGMSREWIGWAALGYLFALLTLLIADILYTPAFLYASGMTVLQMNNNIALNFIMSIPQNVSLYLVLVYFVIKKRTLLEANIIKPVFATKATAILTFSMLVFDLGFLFVLGRAITFERVLSNIPFTYRIMVTLGLCLFPIVNVFALLWGLYAIKNKEAEKQKNEAEKLNTLLAGLNKYTTAGKYDNIEWKLNEIRQTIESVSVNLYKENRKVDNDDGRKPRRKRKQEGIKE